MKPGPIPELIRAARKALALNQDGFSKSLEASKRTVGRWEAGRSTPSREQWEGLARLLYPADRALAGQAAAQLGRSLVQLGLETPPAPVAAPPPVAEPTLEHLVDSIVCAAAAAAGSAPQAVRDSVRAAFERAQAMGISVDKVCEGLRAEPAPPSPRPSPASGRG